MHEKLRDLMAELRLKGMATALDAEMARAEREGVAASEVILHLLLAEKDHHRERSLLYRLNRAKIPCDWTLRTFPFEKQPGVRKAQIRELAGLGFVERGENIVLIGNPGTGKSGIAIGLLREAILSGYRGRFYHAQDLLDELYASLADRSSTRLIKRLRRLDIVAIDELGYLAIKPEQANLFFKLMEERYGKRSTIITTNLPFSSWYDLFQNKSLVDALLDRLKHHCITIHINGPSLRVPSHGDGKPAAKS